MNPYLAYLIGAFVGIVLSEIYRLFRLRRDAERRATLRTMIGGYDNHHGAALAAPRGMVTIPPGLATTRTSGLIIAMTIGATVDRSCICGVDTPHGHNGMVVVDGVITDPGELI